MGSADTSAFASGCRLTSKLPDGAFHIATSILKHRQFEVRILDDAEHIAPRIEHVGHANALAYILDLGARRGAELQQPRMRGAMSLTPQ